MSSHREVIQSNPLLNLRKMEKHKYIAKLFVYFNFIDIYMLHLLRSFDTKEENVSQLKIV